MGIISIGHVYDLQYLMHTKHSMIIIWPQIEELSLLMNVSCD